MWTLTEDSFNPDNQHHKETIFTVGNGYLSTRGALEEGYPYEHRATFVHGVYDDAPIVFTELANAPDWLPLVIFLDGERFSLEQGTVEKFQRQLDLRTGVLTRTVSWLSPSGKRAEITLERFTSLADEHALLIRCKVIASFAGKLEFRASLNGCTNNEGIKHWNWVRQGQRGDAVFLQNRTLKTQIDFVSAMRLVSPSEQILATSYDDIDNFPALSIQVNAKPGKEVTVEKYVAVATSRDTTDPLDLALRHVSAIESYTTAMEASKRAWKDEWERCDVLIEGDEEAQLALRFNIFQLLIAAPRHDDRVNIGAKTLSGFGYRGHSFWDTEIFMLPLFTFTSPHIAKNLLNYRFQRLAGARQKAQSNGYEGAQFPWESADSGNEVTPTWVPHWSDSKQSVRIWTGDIEIHISADIAYAAYQYWQVSGDDAWMVEKGAEIILDTAKFWGSRVEWDDSRHSYVLTDVIGPDEYHDHVDNNWYTNRMAQWNLQAALEMLEWLKNADPQKARQLIERLDLSAERLRHWQEVIDGMYLPVLPSGLIEQFEGYFKLRDVDLASLEPRAISAQLLFGIEGCSETQVIKQPDVLMLQFLLRQHFSDEQVRINYDYYTPRTDHTFGSSLGPAIQTIMACEVGSISQAYEHFIRAVRADLRNIRGNAEDGIHAASAGGTWMAAVFGFAGLQLNEGGWQIRPRLPEHWKRLKFHFNYRGKQQLVDIIP